MTDKTKEADELMAMLAPVIDHASHDAFVVHHAVVAASSEKRMKALQSAGSPTRKLRVTNGNGATEQPEQG
jgi:hypothetical protein